MSSDSWQIGLLIFLIASSAFFSASETALMSINKIRLRHLLDGNVRGAKTVIKLRENSSKLLSTILVGNNIANIAASAVATTLALKFFPEYGALIATISMTIIVLIFGEITPKSIAARNSEKVAFLIAEPIVFFTKVLRPLSWIFTKITELILKTIGINEVARTLVTEEELKTMVDVSREEGSMEEERHQMLHNVFEFIDLQVKDAMVPRTDVMAIEVNTSYEEIAKIFKEDGYSRLPVYEGSIDNIIGILHVKSMLFYEDEPQNFDVRKYMRRPNFTYEYKSAGDLFEELRKQRLAITIVLDEYGGTAGLITMEDLIEEIVGDIEDEYDELDEDVEQVSEYEYIVDGSTDLEDVNEAIGSQLESDDFDSIGGFIIGEIDRFPQVGEELVIAGLEMHVLEIEKNRIQKIRIKVRNLEEKQEV